ncbi:MAG: tryptophan-rich sensory protein [Ruminococcaceae bacterium]|nr:tryptophan-rich sensory protein [Oscillospiraceae bacterium]
MSRNTSIINGTSLFCGIISAVCAFFARMLSGSPLDMVHKLEGIDILPPIWIFNLLSVAWYFLIGAAAGAVIHGVNKGCVRGKEEIWAYRGGIFFSVTFFSGLIWYPLFFVGEALFFSLVTSIIITLSAVLCAYFWFGAKINNAALIMSAYTIWTFYVLIVNLSALFGI